MTPLLGPSFGRGGAEVYVHYTWQGGDLLE